MAPRHFFCQVLVIRAGIYSWHVKRIFQYRSSKACASSYEENPCLFRGRLGVPLPGMAADFPNLYDGNDHGAPPFLLEDGWKPLLNGMNRYVNPPYRAGWTI